MLPLHVLTWQLLHAHAGESRLTDYSAPAARGP